MDKGCLWIGTTKFGESTHTWWSGRVKVENPSHFLRMIKLMIIGVI